MRQAGGVENAMQPFEIIPNPCSGIDESRSAELVNQRLHPATSKGELALLIAEIGPLPPVEKGSRGQRKA